MTASERLPCFKAYDIRGRVPDELDAGLAYAIGRAFVDVIGAGQVCVGRDARLSGPEICGALVDGLNEAGADVLDLGLAGTEEVYFATSHYGCLLYTSPSPRDKRQSRMPSSA